MRRKRFIGWGVLALVIAGGGIAVIQSGMTEVATVRVQGARQLDPLEIRRASGIEPGMNALGLDLEAAAAKVEQVPLVEDASVRRDGAFDVVITITERRPRLIVVTPVGREAMDADATPMALPPAPITLPELRVDRVDALESSAVRAALRTWERLRAGERRRASLAWGAVHGLSVQLGPTLLRLGSGEDLTAKLDAYRAVRRALGGAPRRVDLTQLPRISVAA